MSFVRRSFDGRNKRESDFDGGSRKVSSKFPVPPAGIDPMRLKFGLVEQGDSQFPSIPLDQHVPKTPSSQTDLQSCRLSHALAGIGDAVIDTCHFSECHALVTIARP
jgi:hypothetical protein